MTYFAFRVPPQKEFATVEALKRRGFSAAVPFEVRFLRRHGRKRQKIERPYPLLIGYVIVDMQEPFPWGAIFRLDLIKSVVGFGGVPAPLNPEQTQRMIGLSGQQFPNRRNTRRSLAKGDLAYLNGHGYSEFPVKVEGIEGERAKVMLELFGTEREVMVRLETLRAA